MKGFYNSIRLKKEVLGFFYKNTRFIFMSLSLVLGVLAARWPSKAVSFPTGSLYSNPFFFLCKLENKAFAGIFLNSFAGNLIFSFGFPFAAACFFSESRCPLPFFLFQRLGLGWCLLVGIFRHGHRGNGILHPDHFTRAFVFSCVLLYCCLSAGQFSSELYNRAAFPTGRRT